MVVLPLEIFNLLIDQVAEDESGGLRHLFAEIQITIDSNVRKVAGRLSAVYDSNKDLLAKLRCLTLVFDTRGSGEPGAFLHDIGLGDAGYPVEKQRITKLRTLLKLFARANLESLTIMARNGFLHWSRMSCQSQELFLAIRASPTLRSIHYERIVNLDRGMISREGLHRLTLGLNIDIPSSFVGGNALCATAMENLSSLIKLEIDHTALFHFLPPPWHIATNYLQRLRSLTITLPRDHPSRMDVVKFISHIGKQLRSLHLTSVWYPHPDMDISNEAFFGTFSYDDIPNLHHLTLENGPGHSLLSTSFIAIANILMHAYGARSLSIKYLNIKVELFPAAMQDLDFPPRVNIDEVLTNPALVSSLRDITVHIVVHPDPHGRPIEFLTAIRTSEDLRRFFPRTSVHGGLNLKLCLTHL
ncbi:hypothetical protein D9619_001189 [Psilocybe cf. subviscida]|uniref:Uncharacterized protein n=1 Tax=Psilocybe cf. subviscida TaxID=2480587 RepID=A0A8H5BEU9_9AGAR|nr:hypothetical protein D9619_001189 [Psilocybe cf. subviscida]